MLLSKAELQSQIKAVRLNVVRNSLGLDEKSYLESLGDGSTSVLSRHYSEREILRLIIVLEQKRHFSGLP